MTADGNEEVVAFVQLRAGATLTQRQIQLGLRDQIAPYKCPSRIVMLESLPLGSTGKIWKAKLAEMARHCVQAGLARHKTPERLLCIPELPRTPAGKVRKEQLRKSLRQQT